MLKFAMCAKHDNVVKFVGEYETRQGALDAAKDHSQWQGCHVYVFKLLVEVAPGPAVVTQVD